MYNILTVRSIKYAFILSASAVLLSQLLLSVIFSLSFSSPRWNRIFESNLWLEGKQFANKAHHILVWGNKTTKNIPFFLSLSPHLFLFHKLALSLFKIFSNTNICSIFFFAHISKPIHSFFTIVPNILFSQS